MFTAQTLFSSTANLSSCLLFVSMTWPESTLDLGLYARCPMLVSLMPLVISLFILYLRFGGSFLQHQFITAVVSYCVFEARLWDHRLFVFLFWANHLTFLFTLAIVFVIKCFFLRYKASCIIAFIARLYYRCTLFRWSRLANAQHRSTIMPTT